MAAFFTNFIREYFDAQGRLTHYDYVYENNFNYGYDVTDALGAQYPERLALLWRNEQGEEVQLTFRDIQRLSTQTANLLQSRGLRKGDVLLSALRCHWEHWIVSVAAHKLGGVAYGSDGGLHGGADGAVVKAHHRHVLGHLKPSLLQEEKEK